MITWPVNAQNINDVTQMCSTAGIYWTRGQKYSNVSLRQQLASTFRTLSPHFAWIVKRIMWYEGHLAEKLTHMSSSVQYATCQLKEALIFALLVDMAATPNTWWSGSPKKIYAQQVVAADALSWVLGLEAWRAASCYSFPLCTDIYAAVYLYFNMQVP